MSCNSQHKSRSGFGFCKSHSLRVVITPAVFAKQIAYVDIRFHAMYKNNSKIYCEKKLIHTTMRGIQELSRC